MSTLDQKARAFARKYPTPRSHPNGGDGDWDQDCGAAMSRFCLEYGSEPTGDVRSAYIVYTRSSIVSTDASKAPPGAFHFWDIAGPDNGHVGLDIMGGGTVVFMGNASVTDIEGAVNLGYNSVAGYGSARPAARYLGWSMSYADGTIGAFDPPAPVKLEPYQRVVGPNGVNRRSAPTSQSTLMEEFPAGEVLDFDTWTHGENPYGTNDVWFNGRYSDTWFYSGAFTDSSTTGLTQVGGTTPPPADPYPAKKYAFSTDFPTIVKRVAPADWSNFENVYSEPVAANRKGFPTKPLKVVVHQWGNPNDYTITSVLNTMQARHAIDVGQMSAHFVINGTEIVQAVSLADRAYHASAGGNDFVGLECDPLMTPAVILNIRLVLKALSEKYGRPLEIVLHKNVPGASTSCGKWIEPHLASLDITKAYPPVATPPKPPVPPKPPAKADKVAKAAVVAQIVAIQRSLAKALSDLRKL